VWQYRLLGGDNQLWELKPARGDAFHIIAKHSGKALDVAGWSVDDGAAVFQYRLHGGANQTWRIEHVKDEPANT
jgi:hypothetical protein